MAFNVIKTLCSVVKVSLVGTHNTILVLAKANYFKFLQSLEANFKLGVPKQQKLLPWATAVAKALEDMGEDVFIVINNIDGLGLRFVIFV